MVRKTCTPFDIITIEWFKGFVRYIFAGLFFKSEEEHLWNLEKSFLLHFKNPYVILQKKKKIIKTFYKNCDLKTSSSLFGVCK